MIRGGVGLTLVFAAAIVAAQPPVPVQPPVRSPSVLRIAVDLVQVDAVVTDSRGRHVTDLTASDFEVLQDGTPQKVTTFAYVRAAAPTSVRPAVNPAPIGPARALAPDQVRRTIAIVVDDLGLSFESTARVRETLRRFVERDVQPGDLVAILRTGAGMGALQQFTSDRRMLNAAVERVRWNFMTRSSAFQTGASDPIDEFRNEYFTVGTLGAIQYIVRGVMQMPGRKSVVLLSDGFRLTDSDRQFGRVHGFLQTLIDSANRAGVVIYTIDARGLMVTSPGAADDVVGFREEGGRGAGRPKTTATELAATRRDELRETQDGLGVLAAETGGLFIHDNNDIGAALQRTLDDQQGYYLLGYVPDSATFSTANPKFHSLRVRVTRPGLRVRSRRGFIGRPDQAPRSRSADSRMIDAVTSPFAGGDMSLRLTSFFGQVEKVGPVMHSFMHVDARDLTFTEDADGKHSSQVELLAVTFGDNGQIADQHSRRYTIALPPDSYERALQAGFVYTMRVPVKRPGPYQLRIALRDVTSDRIGSASHFIDVPDVRKGRLTLSGLVIQGAESDKTVTGDADGVDDSDPKATVALRTFRQGSQASYLCTIYNARRGSKGDPQLESEIRLYREGKEVFRNGPRALKVIPGDAAGQFMAGGTLRFREAFPPGTYVLEVVITDRLAKKNDRATQTIDFDVVE